MRKEIVLDGVQYVVTTEINTKYNYIEVTAFIPSPKVSYKIDITLFNKKVFEKRRFTFQSFEKRLEKTITESINSVHNYHRKENRLKLASQRCDEIFNLDKHMHL